MNAMKLSMAVADDDRSDVFALRCDIDERYVARSRVLPFGVAPNACADGSSVRHCAIALPKVEDLALEFLVSSDEEHVRLYVLRGRVAFDLGTRSHNYLLLTLARRRLADAAQGYEATASGWIHLDELAHDPTMSAVRLNRDVFRIRKRFEAIASADAANIVERRPGARQLRLRTGRITIRRV